MNTRTPKPTTVSTRSSLSPIRTVRLIPDPAASTASKELRLPAIDSFSESAFLETHRTSRWPAWHRGPLDRLQMPLTRFRE